MIAQTRAELLKIRSTRTTIGLVLGMLALVILFALLSGLLTKTPDLATKEDQLGLLASAASPACSPQLAGIMLVTSEYRYGTIRPTFLFTPRRSRRTRGQARAGLLAGFGFGVVGGLLGFGIGYAILSGRGIPFALSGGDVALLALGTIAGAAIWGAIGVGLGAIVRNQVGSIITPARLGLRRRGPALRLRVLGRTVRASPCVGRTHGPPSRSSPLARRRRDHVDRLGRRTHGGRHRPVRSAGHRLTPG